MFYGGTNTIGGTIIEVAYQNHRLLFDFGYLASGIKVANGTIKYAKNNRVREFLSLGLVPAIDGLYQSKAVYGTRLRSAEEDDRETIVCVSHLHLDHSGAMDCVSPTIPVYLTRESIEMKQTLHWLSESDGLRREYALLPYFQPLQHGEISIEAVPMDHDIPGACGFLIRTPDTTMFYTGDFRLHGRHAEKVWQAVEHVREAGVDCLICEATSCFPDEGTKEFSERSEEDVVSALDSHLRNNAERLVAINLYERNVERFLSCLACAEQNGRQAVVDAQVYAFIAPYVTSQTQSLLWLNLTGEHHQGAVTIEEMKQAPGQYVWFHRYEDLLLLVNFTGPTITYLHANGVPLGAYDPRYDVLQTYLHKNGIMFTSIGSSGHATPSALQDFVNRINPDLLIPIHSLAPEKLQAAPAKKRLLPKEQQRYTVRKADFSLEAAKV